MSETENVTEFPTSNRHKWDIHNIKRIPAVESIDGNDRTERFCERCHLVKITVHSPDNRHWNEWRHPNGAVFQCDQTPPCMGEAL